MILYAPRNKSTDRRLSQFRNEVIADFLLRCDSVRWHQFFLAGSGWRRCSIVSSLGFFTYSNIWGYWLPVVDKPQRTERSEQMVSEMNRVPSELLQQVELMQDKIYKSTRVFLSKPQAMRVLVACSEVSEVKLNKVADWLRANRKKARNATFIDLR